MMSLDALSPSLSSSYSARLSIGGGGGGGEHVPIPSSPASPSTVDSHSSTVTDVGPYRRRSTRHGHDGDRLITVHPDDVMRLQVLMTDSPVSSPSFAGREELTSLYRSQLLGVTSPSHPPPTSPNTRPVTTCSSSRPSHLQLPHSLSPAPSNPSPLLHLSSSAARPSTRPALTPLSSNPSSSTSRPSRSHRSSLGHPLSVHHLPHLSEHAQRSIVAQSTLLSSPAGLKMSLTPSLSSTPLPYSPSSTKLPLSSSSLPILDQENAHPNLAQLTRSMATLDITSSQAEKRTRQALSPSLSSLGLLKAGQQRHPSSSSSSSSSSSLLSPCASRLLSTPLPSRSTRPVKRLSYGSARPLTSTTKRDEHHHINTINESHTRTDLIATTHTIQPQPLPLALPPTPAPSPPSPPSAPSATTNSSSSSSSSSLVPINRASDLPSQTPRVAPLSSSSRSGPQTSHVRKMR